MRFTSSPACWKSPESMAWYRCTLPAPGNTPTVSCRTGSPGGRSALTAGSMADSLAWDGSFESEGRDAQGRRLGAFRRSRGDGQAGLSSWLVMKSAGALGLQTAAGRSSQSFGCQFSVMQSMSLEYSIQLPQGSWM